MKVCQKFRQKRRKKEPPPQNATNEDGLLRRRVPIRVLVHDDVGQRDRDRDMRALFSRLVFTIVFSRALARGIVFGLVEL